MEGIETPPLDAVKAFVLSAELGSFAEAARHLDVVPSTISKKVSQLENHYGVQLMRRTTRSLSLTEEGRFLYERGHRLLDEFERIGRRLELETDSARGLLRVTTIPAFGQLQLARILPHFLDHYSDISVELMLTDRVIDLASDGFDVAIRFGRLPDSDLVGRLLGQNIYRLCAAPDYLDAHGIPEHPRELRDHSCLTDPIYPPLSQWKFDWDGEEIAIVPRGRLATQDPVARYHAALGGMGICALPQYVVTPAIARGELIDVFADHPLDLGPIWALHLTRRHTPRRIEVFLDYLVEELTR